MFIMCIKNPQGDFFYKYIRWKVVHAIDIKKEITSAKGWLSPVSVWLDCNRIQK